MAINFFGGYKARKYEVTEDFKLGGKQIFDADDKDDKLVKVKIINLAHDTADLDEDGIEIFTIPKGDTVLNISARVTEVWNSASSDALTIKLGNDITICNGKDIKTAVGLLAIEDVLPTAISAEDQKITAKVVSTGTAATKGKLEIIITYTI